MATIDLNSPLSCPDCKKSVKYYAKGLCHPCYHRSLRKANPDRYRKYDRDRAEYKRGLDRKRYANRRDRGDFSKARANNIEKIREYDRVRGRTEERKQYIKQLRLKNIEKIRVADRLRYFRDKPKRLELIARRYSHKGLATPKWLTKEHKDQLRHIYKNRPPGHHVDHIIPIQGKNVSGLHVPWNLQYLPAADNIRKGNKHE